jgi:membrane protein YdbS with pleckstrin-like domain
MWFHTRHMRRIISFVLALCLTATGAVGLIYLLMFAHGWRGWMFMGAGLMLVAGVVWFYSDFIDATPREGV